MKKNMLIQIVIFCLITPLFAQKEIKVKGIEGSYIISQDITPKQAKEKALEEAKKNALREAGISENISSTNVLATDADKEDMEQVFNEFSSVEINGKVIDWEIISEEKYEDQYGNFVVKVVINADVVKYRKEQDKSFRFKVEGVDEYYLEGDKMHFNFLPFKPGYLKLFYFDADLNCDIIFPNPYEKNRLFEANDTTAFPVSHMIEYEMTTEKEKEINHMVFVFTKKDFPFTEEVNYKNLLRWLYTISPDQRAVQYFSYIIKGND